MQVIFIRHATAEPAGAGGDAARRLTAKGRTGSAAAAEALSAMGVKLARVLSSPLVRAMQTAGIAAEAHGAELEEAEFLAPPGDAKAMRSRLAKLAGEAVETVGLVGHAPSLDELLGELAAGSDDIGVSLPKGGVACVELPPAESGDAPELRWLLRRKQLALLAGRAKGKK